METMSWPFHTLTEWSPPILPPSLHASSRLHGSAGVQKVKTQSPLTEKQRHPLTACLQDSHLELPQAVVSHPTHMPSVSGASTPHALDEPVFKQESSEMIKGL
jgi:hypothetical protein